MNGLRIYLRERFPVITTAILALTFSALLIGVSDSHSKLLLTPVALTFFCFMLRQRVTDEFKDAKHDGKNYPNRPYQRGAIGRRTLITLGASAFAVELVTVLLLGLQVGNVNSFIFYALVLAFALLLAYEFFIPNWLEAHFNVYFVSHQLIFMPLVLWFNSLSPSANVLKSLICTLVMMIAAEIARKYELRVDPNGNPVRDTYLTVWGPRVSQVIVLGCFLVYSMFIGFWYLVLVPAVSLAIIGRNPKLVQATIFLCFITMIWTVFFSA